MTSFDNNKDKVCLLLKDNVSGSHVRLCARSYDLRSCDYGVTYYQTPNILATWPDITVLYNINSYLISPQSRFDFHHQSWLIGLRVVRDF